MDLRVHQDYDLPLIFKDTLVIASSYSGNTEEPISSFTEAVKRGLPLAVISTGGKLLELAKEHKVPYIQIPDTGIQPRAALGFTVKALLQMVGEKELLEESSSLATLLHATSFEEQGKALAKTLQGKIPIIYSSRRNFAIAYNWKIKFNETGKVPAFYNVFPELNHNEMAGFGVEELNKPFLVILLQDEKDDPRIQKRMEVLRRLYQDRGLIVERISLAGSFQLLKVFSSLVLADWTAYFTALIHGADPEQVPMIEEFKKQIG